MPVSAPLTQFRMELPCGVVEAFGVIDDGVVTSTGFISVPSFLFKEDVRVEVPGHGEVAVDIVYGGAFYAILTANSLGLNFFDTPLDQLVDVATRITDTCREICAIEHPTEPDLGFLYGTIITDDAAPAAPSYNLCVFGDGQIDRSPTGSGVTARMARDFQRGLISAGIERTFYGPTGEPFVGSIEQDLGSAGVRVRVSGKSYYSGRMAFEIEADDPLAAGFQIGGTYRDVTRRADATRIDRPREPPASEIVLPGDVSDGRFA